jgi:drug/metabolite transporter (DMT)-like permease
MSSPVMSHSQPQRRTGRSIVALVAGMLAGIVLSIGTDMALHATGIFPPLGQPMSDRLFLLATAYRTVYSILGSYIAARLAPHHPMAHALLLGAVGVVVCIVGAVTTWNRGPEFGPHWYPLTLVVLALPCAWIGGLLRTKGRVER